MKTILVPVDFSEYADNALYMAANIAKREDAEIHLIHTLGFGDHLLGVPSNTMAADAIPFIKFTEMRFNQFIDKPFLKDIKLNVVVKKSSVLYEIADYAKEIAADLIVMGSHGSTGIEEYFLGSNTQKVVRHSEVPVMVVKRKMRGFRIEKAVFVCDFHPENANSYKQAVDFFKTLDVKMHLAYINTPENFKNSVEIEQLITQFFKHIERDYQRYSAEVQIFNAYSVEEGIMDYCKVIEASLIGIPTHGRKGLSHFFMGSIGEHVVNHSQFPVITFKI